MTTTAVQTPKWATSLVSRQAICGGRYIYNPDNRRVKDKNQRRALGVKRLPLVKRNKALNSERCSLECAINPAGLYKAVVVIHDVPKNLRNLVESLIDSEAKRIMGHHSPNRLLEISETIDGYEVRVASPKVAKAISQKLIAIFKASKMVSERHTATFQHKADAILYISVYL